MVTVHLLAREVEEITTRDGAQLLRGRAARPVRFQHCAQPPHRGTDGVDRALRLVVGGPDLGDGTGLASYVPLAWQGRLAWLLKKHIDRGFISEYDGKP